MLGLGTDGLRDRQAVSDDTLVYYSGLLAQRPRSAQALQQILADYFEVPVEIEQFAGGWYRLDPETQCRLSESSSESGELGFGAVVGDEVWNQQSRVRIVLGPLTLERYADFLPDGQSWEPLRAWVKFFSNDEWDFEVKLILEREQVPACTLGAEGAPGPQLGWVSWVKSVPFGRDPDDTVLALETAEGGNVMNLKSLIGKLNDSTRGALEAAAGLCLARTHYDIEVEHYLTKLLDSTDNDAGRDFQTFRGRYLKAHRRTGSRPRQTENRQRAYARAQPHAHEDADRGVDHRFDRLQRRTGAHRLYHSRPGDE